MPNGEKHQTDWPIAIVLIVIMLCVTAMIVTGLLVLGNA